ncbi:MAG: hypothetical protein JW941_09955, partial [Candidatus Coatesbacteria bacterium]|nr:hypothetical protein [Candidatus Coatesbacteria bacterium]
MSYERSTRAGLLMALVLLAISGICSAIPIGLQCGTYDPDLTPVTVPDEFSKGLDQAEPTDFFIVQFDAPITPAMRSQLTDQGARILRYIPTYAYLVKMDGAKCAEMAADGAIYHVEPYQPFFKVSTKLYPYMAAMGGETPEKKAVILTIQVFAGEDCDAVSKTIADAGFSAKELAISTNTRGGKIKMSVLATQLDEFIAFVSRIKAVEWVEEWSPFELNNHEARWVTQSYL